MAHENESIFELVEHFMSDQRVILRAVVMNAIERAIQNGMSLEDVTDAIRPLLGWNRTEGQQAQNVIKSDTHPMMSECRNRFKVKAFSGYLRPER